MKRNELFGTIVFTLLVGTIIGSVSGFNSGLQAAYSATGTQNSLSEDWIETESANFSKYYLDDTNITDRLTGDWGSTNLTTTGSVNTADLNLTSDIYYNDENRTDLIANPEFQHTYVIGTDGTNVWMTDTSTGQRDDISTDTDVVFSWVEGNLSTGDSVFIDTGNYPTGDTMITCNVPDTFWEGAGLGTNLSWSTAFFKMTAENITIRKLKVVTPIGEGSTIDIIQIWKNNCKVEYTELTGGRRGILISSGVQGVEGHYASILNNDCLYNDDKGIDADLGTSYGEIARCYVLGSNDTGIELYKGCHGWSVHDNTVEDAANDAYTICGAYYSSMKSNRALGTGRTAFWLGSETAGYDSYGNEVIGNIINMTGADFEGNVPFVFHVEALGGQEVHEILIMGNIIWMDNGQHVLSCTGSSVYNIFFTDNICLMIKNYFVEINAAHHIYVKDGYMGDPTNAATYPVKIKNAAHDIVIESVVIETDAGFAIYIEHATGYDIDLIDLILTGGGIYNLAHNVTMSGGRITGATKGVETSGDNGTIADMAFRDCTSALDINAAADFTWIHGNDLRFNADDVTDQGTGTIWTDNLDRLGAFHEANAPDV